MFGKKSCRKCGKKISNSYDFCPFCGIPIREKEDWGMLGKRDFLSSSDNFNLPFGFNSIFNSLVKNLDKQFKNLEGDFDKNSAEFGIPKGKGISISISASGNEPPRIKVKQFGGKPKKKESKKAYSVALPQNILKSFSKLPRQEPSTNVRRLSDRVIYEISLPGVTSVENVSVARLEESIEIKAISKDKSYYKIIPVNLPVVEYDFSKGRLILEFGVKN